MAASKSLQRREADRALKRELKTVGNTFKRWRTPIAVAALCVAFALAMSTFLVSEEEDPYKVLGVKHGADLLAIRKAYRRLSLMYHPEKVPSKDMENAFFKVQRAYEMLTDCVQGWE